MAGNGAKHRWAGAVRQVTKSNFAAALRQLRDHVDAADFVAVSCRRTGDCAVSSGRYPWRRVLSIDTPEIAYLKAKLAAETYQILQFAVCPFRFRGARVLASPYNFHLFPRDELHVGMPSYSFSCQTSFLTSMAQEGFDFNACIYDGISYLSRVQESMFKGNSSGQKQSVCSHSSFSTDDAVLMSRIRYKVEHWRKACKDSNATIDAVDGALVTSLRKLLLGSELYGSRPSTRIDLCSDRQVQLVLQMISQVWDDLVALVVPDKSGEPRAIRVVLTSSEEDKNLLMNEIQNLEEELNLKVRGFREVIDVISSSNKPIIGYNCLHDFTFIHSKFVAPLPSTLSEFMCSLRLAFTNVLDISHLSKEIGVLRKAKNLHAALTYLKRQFFLPIDIELPAEDEGSSNKAHGYNVLQITELFAAVSTFLKLFPDGQIAEGPNIKAIEEYSNIFYPIRTVVQEYDDEELSHTMDAKKVRTDNLVFLWGFGQLTALELKHILQQTHVVFKEGFDLQFVDKTCAAVVFSRAESAKTLLEEMSSGRFFSNSLSEEFPGLRAAGYDAYRKVCKLGLWEANLPDSLENVIMSEAGDLLASSEKDAYEVYWRNGLAIDLNDFLENAAI